MKVSSMDKIKPSKKLAALPPYIFSRINALKAEVSKTKMDVIDLGMGNPDFPTPSHIVDRLCDTVKNHHLTHRYPQSKGMPRFRKAVAAWMENRFGVELDPAKEIISLIGSKEGIAHLCTAYLDPGDYVLVCDPAYPVHFNGVILAGGQVYSMPIVAENNFLPDLTKVPANIAKKAKFMFLNYPNNPTAAVIDDKKFLPAVVAFAKKYGILVVFDNAYSELTFGDYVAPSFFEIPGAWDVGLEFHSFSKTFNMAGWRIGWACGPSKFLAPLEKLKSFLDYGAPTFIQLAAVAALENSQDCVHTQAAIYERRMKKMVAGLNKIGWPAQETKGTMYLWLKIPPALAHMKSLDLAEHLIQETGVVVTPGIGFGASGEGYIRISLVTHDNRFHDALLRLKKFIKTHGK
ncbi:MAG: LL-diaminopimelate aminotransferase [Elusimicrobia bacterium]|nr:LL-diaminopimelate aminotransferase [Elusimicrobiota bacterium]